MYWAALYETKPGIVKFNHFIWFYLNNLKVKAQYLVFIMAYVCEMVA